MLIHSKELLMTGKKYYTLTVVTNPASATCTLTYDGNSYNSKYAIVKAGTVISYSVDHATYGITTGSITMNSDKTLTCNGTYSTSEAETSWTQPVLTSNGTIGTSDFAVSATDYRTNRQPYQCFAGSGCVSSTATKPWYYTMYSKIPIKMSEIQWKNNSVTGYNISAGTFQCSTNGTDWVDLATIDNTVTANAVRTCNVNAAAFYNYYRFNVTQSHRGDGGYLVAIGIITITATYMATAYTYYWDVTTT